jgi:hypothetical protein
VNLEAEALEVIVMAIDGTRRGWRGFIICLLMLVASWGVTLMVLGFDAVGIVPLAFIWMVIVSTWGREAAGAGDSLITGISVGVAVILMGVGSAGMLAHTGVTFSTVGALVPVWLAGVLLLVLQLTWKWNRS